MLQQGQKIADIGAGGGYFSLRFAEAVGKQGVVYAVDTDSGKIEFIRKSVAQKGLGNVKVVLASKESVALPECESHLTRLQLNLCVGVSRVSGDIAVDCELKAVSSCFMIGAL